MCACFTSCYSCSSCASFSLLHSSCYSLSFCFNSYNSFSSSYNFFFSLYLYAILLSHCCLFTSMSKYSLKTTRSSLNLHICSTFTFSTTFLLPLSSACRLPFTTNDDVATFYTANHSTTTLTGSLSLEKL